MRRRLSLLILILLFITGGCRDKPAPSLHKAVDQGDIELVKKLIVEGADLNEKNFRDETPLYRAVYRNHKEIVTILIINGANLNCENKYGETPLKIAVRRKRKEIVKFLIQAGAEATISQAVYAGDIEKVEKILQDGADVNKREKFAPTLLEIASREGNKDMVTLLIANGAKIEPLSESLLNAVENGHEEVAKILIAHGADIDAKGLIEGSPLHLAAAKGYMNIVELLLANGADINVKDFYDEFTPIHLAVEHGHEDIVDFF